MAIEPFLLISTHRAHLPFANPFFRYWTAQFSVLDCRYACFLLNQSAEHRNYSVLSRLQYLALACAQWGPNPMFKTFILFEWFSLLLRFVLKCLPHSLNSVSRQWLPSYLLKNCFCVWGSITTPSVLYSIQPTKRMLLSFSKNLQTTIGTCTKLVSKNLYDSTHIVSQIALLQLQNIHKIAIAHTPSVSISFIFTLLQV